MTEAAEALGVSRQRISQLYKAMGIPMQRGRRSKHLSRLQGQPIAGARTGRGAAVVRLQPGGVVAPLSSNTAGHVSELMAAADLLARGYAVFAPIAQTTAPVDLVIVSRDSGKAERIEVRSGVRRDGKVSWARSGGMRRLLCDRYAIVLAGEPVRYDPPFAGDEPVEYIPERLPR